MASVHVEMRGFFECPRCGSDSETYPTPNNGLSVVCEHCGAKHRVKSSGYSVVDWNAHARRRVAAIAAAKNIQEG